ncbi:23S rRNA (uracil(1939)-C(5))-methyltransferase RlmD [Gemella sp. 19428wG2_WT2a]|nr:23S rRNA (uracil(1939)-C(5))-methyltransferase RlmD [Gemella sp. 19428wG2_WT2a]TFU60092.1 23S rRNA (uracil(1939)-C(5))-methyltransferase RlmD [Gemella sp. WT2a]
MNKNEIYRGIISDYSHDGMGILKINNFPIFIADVIVGEEVEVKIIKSKKNLAYGKLINLIKSSVERREVIEKSSGANLMHMSYNEQLKFKTRQVKNIMDKMLGRGLIEVLDTIGMEDPYHYRNKSVVPVQKKDGFLKMGYYRPRSHDVVDTNKCIIQFDEHNHLTNDIRKIISKLNLSVYNEEKHEGAIRHMMFRTNTDKTEIMVAIIAKEKFAGLDKFVEKIKALDKRIKSIMLNINSRKTNVIFGEDTYTLYGQDYISDDLDGIKFNISLRSFYQVNPKQTKNLYQKAIDLADLKEEDNIIDAYCGIGTISLFAARKVKQVYGIEIVEAAVENAKENARSNGLKNVEFLLGKSEDKIKELINKDVEIDAVIVDPPRKGCEESFLQDLAKMKIKKVVYVSCNPASLARDMKIMQDLGYRASQVQPVDMFPQTPHVECVVLMTKN